MIIDEWHGLLFVHIPKTGGESVAHILRSFGGVDFLEKHSTASHAKAVLGDKPILSFAVVRNPFDQVVSFYNHLRKQLYVSREKLKAQYPHLNGEYVGPVEACKMAMSMPFNAFVDAVYYRREIQHPYFQDQTGFICDDDGSILCSEVYRYERISELFLRLGRMYAVATLDIPYLNKSERVEYESYYDSRTREIVEGYFNSTIDLFGYSF